MGSNDHKKIIIKLSVSFLLSVSDEEYLSNCTIDVSIPTNISVQAATLPHPIQFNLFDHVRVSLKLRKSHAHRHMVYMTLIDLEHTKVAKSIPNMSKDTLMKAVIESSNNDDKEEIEDANDTEIWGETGGEKISMSKQEIETRRQLKKNTKQQGNMYDFLEQFRKMSIAACTYVDNPSTN